MAKTYDFDDFCQITEMLRKKEGGCPWDLSQTHQSLKPYMLSETAEAVAAIDLYAEEGLFTINDVVQSISEKMIRRHPHVFGEESYELLGGHADSWKEIKQIEKAGMSEDQKKAQERAVYLATQQIIEHLQKSLDKYGDNDYK